MKILVVSEWYSESMGYAENLLPKALAALGHEVHLITTNTQIYFNSPIYASVYEPFLGPGIVECGTKKIDGYTLHRLPHFLWRNQIGASGLAQIIRELHPDIVQTFDVQSLTTLQLAILRSVFSYRLFLEAHIHSSVLPKQSYPSKKSMVKKSIQKIIGFLLSSIIERCYPISIDAAWVASNYFGILPRKMTVIPLGVDTDLFKPISDPQLLEKRNQIRKILGFHEKDIVSIYTGRLSPDKNPLCLAQSVQRLQLYSCCNKGLFIGNGPQEGQIAETPGCVVHPFVPAVELADYYRAADIGVWPKQESTSQIDAAVCGLPIIISDHTQVPERIQGNGLTYHEDDPEDLALKIASLSDSGKRLEMGMNGSQRLSEQYSWKRIATDRITDYMKALLPRV